MADKKDPGKFTVRFNIHDPQHQTVVALLNQQGAEQSAISCKCCSALHQLQGNTEPAGPARRSGNIGENHCLHSGKKGQTKSAAAVFRKEQKKRVK